MQQDALGDTSDTSGPDGARVELLALALDLGSDAVALVDYATMHYIDVNVAMLRLYGLTRERFLELTPWELTGRPRKEFEQAFGEAVAMSPQPQRTLVIETATAGGRTAVLELQRQAHRMNGRWIVVTSRRDITERRDAQARMERLATALDMGDDAVFLIDRKSMTHLEVNRAACALVGLSHDELIAAAPRGWELEAGEGEALAAIYDGVISQAPATVTTEVLVHRDAPTSMVCEVRRQAIRSADDRWVIVETLRDIRERRRAEQEIRGKVAELTRSNEELERFAYVISHDLSEPLRAVGSYAQLLERRYAPRLDDDGREFVTYIIDGAKRMRGLLEDLLTYARAGQDRGQAKRVPLDLALDDALANLRHGIERTGAVVRREPLPPLLAERAGMAQVFQNLIGNAIKFGREGVPPNVEVRAEEVPAGWVVSVADNGIGIEPKFFRKIFDVFQRLNPRDQYEGSGIGLAICKKVVEQHGGRIEVVSSPGTGTKFAIHLPGD
ncbi:MAG: ATP-binding protein [Pseudomonadota bacterium]